MQAMTVSTEKSPTPAGPQQGQGKNKRNGSGLCHGNDIGPVTEDHTEEDNGRKQENRVSKTSD